MNLLVQYTLLGSEIFVYFLHFIYLFLCMCVCVTCVWCVVTAHVCKGQGQLNWVFSFLMRVLGIELSFSDLVTRSFTHWAILTTQEDIWMETMTVLLISRLHSLHDSLSIATIYKAFMSHVQIVNDPSKHCNTIRDYLKYMTGCWGDGSVESVGKGLAAHGYLILDLQSPHKKPGMHP